MVRPFLSSRSNGRPCGRRAEGAGAPTQQRGLAQRAYKDGRGRVQRTVARKVEVEEDPAEYANTPARRYINFTGFPFPIGPIVYRKTTCREIIKDTMWAFEQPQSLAFSNVAVNVRMTVTLLASGGLLVYNPIAPTDECLAELAALAAPVEFILLGSAAYEHKVYVGPFSRRFPKAEVHVAPQQWSFPLNLPVQLFGIFPKSTLQHDDAATPWAADFEQKVLAAPKFAVTGRYSEVALYHKASRTVLLTEAVIQIPVKPPPCLSAETLLDNAKNGFVVRTADAVYSEEGADLGGRIYDGRRVPDTPGNRLRGWQRICLLVCFFGTANLYDPEDAFNTYAGRPLVFPVVGSLVFSRCQESVRAFIDDLVADWNFKQIVPSHFDAPVPCNGTELVAAFQRSTDVYSVSDARRAAAGNADGAADDAGASAAAPQGLLQQLLALRRVGSKPGDNVLDPEDLKALENLNWFLEWTRAVDKRPSVEEGGRGGAAGR